MHLFFVYLFIYLFIYFGGGGGGRLFEAGRLLTFPTYRVGAYSRWALIGGWALNRINTVAIQYPLNGLTSMTYLHYSINKVQVHSMTHSCPNRC